MHMIRHHDITVKVIIGVLPIANRSDDHLCDLRLLKIQRTSLGIVKNAIHHQESLSSRSPRRKRATLRNAAIQPPSQEHRLADSVYVREAAGMKGLHSHRVGADDKIPRPITNRPQAASLPHIYCLIIVPSFFRISPQPPLRVFRSPFSPNPNGYFAAAFSSTSIPHPGASFTYQYPSFITGHP